MPLSLAWASAACPRAAQRTPPGKLHDLGSAGRAGGWWEGEVPAQPSPNQSDFFAEVSGGVELS